MKKTLFTLLFLMSFTLSSQAQNNLFSKGDVIIDAGVGIGSHLYTGSGFSSRMPLIFTSFEIGVADNLFDNKSSLGIGGYVGYTGAKWETGNNGWKYSDWVVGARGNLHYQFFNKFDTYASGMLGYDFLSTKSIGSIEGLTNDVSGGLVFHVKVGARYYFTENFAAMAEVGYGVAFLNVGISYKF